MASQKLNIRIFFKNKTVAAAFVDEVLPPSRTFYVLTTTTEPDGSEVYCVSSVIDTSSVSTEMLLYLKQQLSISEVTQIYMFLKESEERKEDDTERTLG